MDRHTRITALLARTAIWCWVVSCVLMAIIYRRQSPPTIIAVTMAVTTIAMGLLSLSAFVIHGMTGGTWRFSLAGLLATTTAIAMALGLVVFMLRGS